MMMIVPVDPHKDEAKRVAQEDRRYRTQRLQIPAVRNLELQNYIRDNDRYNAVAKGFCSLLFDLNLPQFCICSTKPF